MNNPPAIGLAFQFPKGFQDFRAGRSYTIIAIRPDSPLGTPDFLLVEIDYKSRRAARESRVLSIYTYNKLVAAGDVLLCEPPTFPKKRPEHVELRGAAPDVSGKLNDSTTISKSDLIQRSRESQLQPLINMAREILNAKDPSAVCNKIARENGLNVTRSRELFFLSAANCFDPSALYALYLNCGSKSLESIAIEVAENYGALKMPEKRGRKVKDPTSTPPGWPFDHLAWPTSICSGWKKHTAYGRPYQQAWTETLRTEFGCIVQRTNASMRIFSPTGISFPSYKQFAMFIQRKFGKHAWKEAKYGKQTLRNHMSSCPDKASSYLVNLLEEVQWDGQILDERPGDFLDPSQPGEPIVRIVATCAAIGGPVGVGYDYANESRWGYLMALLSMGMKKSVFCGLFGVTISDHQWPAIGLMLSTRGDRGPSISRDVQKILAEVLEIWQEWAASYDPIGKATAEAGHHKTVHIEGRPIVPSKYRNPIEIIRDDLRQTVKKFCTADMSHRLDPDQARRGIIGTPLGLWNDLMSRSLYAGQIEPIEKILRVTTPRHEISIMNDGVHLHGLRYLSKELRDSGLLDKAAQAPLTGFAFCMNMVTRYIWLDLSNRLMQLEAVPVRFNSMESTHSLTIEESIKFAELIARSRRTAEKEQAAMSLYNGIENAKDAHEFDRLRRELAPSRSSGIQETTRQHKKVLCHKE